MPPSYKNLSLSPDAALVDDLKRRDKAAMAEFVRRHGAKMYAVALQMTRNQSLAQEVVQDALIMVWNKIASFEGRSSLTTWLYRVTANAALMALRKSKITREHIAIEELDLQPGAEERDDKRYRPDGVFVRGEIEAAVRHAIDSLPEPYRTTVLLAWQTHLIFSFTPRL